jgi:transglutaminase-like putative cysteine protease
MAVVCAIGGAALLASIAQRVPSRLRAWSLAVLAALAAFAAMALALGVPARLLLPSGWGELAADIGDGFGSLGNAEYPYAGGDPWSRQVLLLGLAPLLAAVAALLFWPARGKERGRRRLALLLLVSAYGFGVTMTAASLPLLRGLVLLVLIAAWLWLPSLDRRGVWVAGGLLAAAGLAAIPAAARMDASNPWLDYSHWDWGATPAGKTESFNWEHNYGPIDWKRDGRALLSVRSARPEYWSTEVLGDFDGYGWTSSPPGQTVDLPLRADGRAAPLRPEWIVRARFRIGALSSPLLVGTGTPLAVSGVREARRTAQGVSVSDPPQEGDSYSVRAYAPQPSAGQMRAADGRYPAALAAYTTIEVPRVGGLRPPPGHDTDPQAMTVDRTTVPLRGGAAAGGSVAVQRAQQIALDDTMSHSPYQATYRLAQHLAAGQSTAFGVATAVQRYLRSNYRYDENPPKRTYPLPSFLFRDRIGYCQQFSGAMALLLRMDGIPTRVVGGFAPGHEAGMRFEVTDFDAHSWVEVYFDRIGWVTFDPTPAAAPAIARSTGLFTRGPRRRARAFKDLNPPPVTAGGKPAAAVPSGGGPGGTPWAPIAGLVALVGAALALVFRYARRGRPGSEAELAEAQAVELQEAVARLRGPVAPGTTLRGLARRLRSEPRAAIYAERLGGCRYGAAAGEPPSAADRRRARRALASGGGLRERLRAWIAMPPGGPAPRS